MKILEVPLDNIDTRDERFRYSYHFDLEKLVASISTIGLVNPLLVVKRGSSRYVIVSGWKRISACLQLSMSHIPVCLVEERDDLRIFLLSLYENWTFRTFEILEKAEILLKLTDFVDEEKKLVQEFFPLLDIPSHLSYLDIYLKIARLEHDWKEIVFRKKIPLSTIQLLIEFSPEDREVLLPVILPMNMNKMRQFCQDLFDLSKKNGETPKTLLAAPEILGILRAEKLSSLQKAERIRSVIHEKRCPTLSSWKKSFDESLRKAELTKSINYDPDSFFEDGEFSVTFSLGDKKDFQDRLSRLKELVDDENLFSLFKNDPDG